MPRCVICDDLAGYFEFSSSTSVYAVQASARYGCSGCKAIFDGLLAWGPQPLPDAPLYLGGSSSAQKSNITKVRAYRSNGLDLEFSVEQCPSSYSPAVGECSLLRVCTTSNQGLSWVQALMRTCDDSHKKCTQKKSSFLPTRLLDLGDPQTPKKSLERQSIKLIEPGSHASNHIGQYVCLSHCWGDDGHTLTTTIETIASRKENIALEDLPPLFADAVNITRSLGHRHLWIDSLCILQDSQEDWEIESSMMSSVYSNSYVTLAAVSASSSQGRCTYSHVKEFTATANDGHQYRVYLGSSNSSHWRGAQYDPKEFPLLTRGWVYQERLLSPRIVYFGSKELLWECNQTATCQCRGLEHKQGEAVYIKGELVWECNQNSGCYCHGQGRDRKPDHLFSGQRAVRKSLSHNTLLQQRLTNAGKQWHQRIWAYTHLELTKGSDKLRAINGIAIKMSKCFKYRYLDGLWEDNLYHDLLWTSFLGEPSRSLQPPRPNGRAIPSWSWASIDGQIIYTYPFELRPLVRILSIYPRNNVLIGESNPRAGKLCVLGSMSAGKLNSSSHLYAMFPDGGLVYQRQTIANNGLTTFAIPVDRVILDYNWNFPGPDMISNQTTLHLLRIAADVVEEINYCWVIRKLESSESNEPLYQRIGLVRLSAQDPPDTASEAADSQSETLHEGIHGTPPPRASGPEPPYKKRRLDKLHSEAIPKTTAKWESGMPIEWEERTITII